MSKNIFFIGPAGVGKTTVGALVAKKMHYAFIDIDEKFCEKVDPIPVYVKRYGYPAYCEANSALVDDLLKEHRERTIFATPSGFLVHEDSPHLIQKHVHIIRSGISILLMPSTDIDEAVKIIVERQLKRWDDVTAEREEYFFSTRFPKYIQHGDVQIFSRKSPEIIAQEIIEHIR